MSLLDYVTNRSLAQELRMRRAAVTSRQPVLVVEGPTDARALRHFVEPSLSIHPAGGRERLFGAYDELLTTGDGSDFLFLVDCDNGVPDRYKGHLNLVISDFRDLESDLLLALQSLDRYLCEHFAQAPTVLERSLEIAIRLGRLKDAARAKGVPVRRNAPGRSQRQRVLMEDVFGCPPKMAMCEIDDETLIDWFGGLVGWDQNTLTEILDELRIVSRLRCRAHDVQHCSECLPRQYCNGHDLLEIVRLALAEEGHQVSVPDLESAVRMCASDLAAQRWKVTSRLRRYQEVSGNRVIAGRLSL